MEDLTLTIFPKPRQPLHLFGINKRTAHEASQSPAEVCVLSFCFMACTMMLEEAL